MAEPKTPGTLPPALARLKLAKLLKEGTLSSHKAAENVTFIREFIKGNISRDAYCQLLVNLLHVYQAMEEEFDKNWEHALLEPIYFPEELSRTQALKMDVQYFGAELLRPSARAVAYATRLREVGSTSPELLLPHAYTRYLGDLSGGQVLKRCAMRGMKLPGDGSGTRFYEFPRIKDVKQFKDLYRARLDSLVVNEAQRTSLVDEAKRAFELNMDMFEELSPVIDSPVTEAVETNVGNMAAMCPFAALAGSMPLPEGHPLLPFKHGSNSPKSTGIDKNGICGKAHCESSCPLAHFGRSAPKIAAVVLPMAVGVASSLLAW